ncbi:MAG: zf-HC2 domain-containing protein [Desulfotomaculales bacterium]
MSCFRMRALFSAYLDHELPPAARHALERHLASCATCRRELDAWRTLSGALRRLGEEPVAVPAGFRTRLMERLPVRDTTVRRRWSPWSAWSRNLRLSAAAAVLALLIAGVSLSAGSTGRAPVLPWQAANRQPPVVITAPPATEQTPSDATAPQPQEENRITLPATRPGPDEAGSQPQQGAPTPVPPAPEKPTTTQPVPRQTGLQVAFTSKTAERVAVSLWLEVPRLSDATAEMAAVAQQYRASQKNTSLGPGADGRARMLVTLNAPAGTYEALLERLAGVGRETDRRVTRTDATSELNALEAERVRLEGEMESLRRQGADVAHLEDQIRDLERKRDELGRVTIAVWLTETGAEAR